MTPETNTGSEIRASVSGAYTAALARSKERKGGACCAPTCCEPSDTDSAPASYASTLYGEEAERYADTAVSSFGCGNPLAFAAVGEGDTVLDLGSGAGLDLLLSADRVGPTGAVIGVDMTDAMIDAAREAAARAGHTNIEVRKGEIEALPVADSSVDHVISNCVINLSPEKEKVFGELQRVLKPGGHFSISDIVVEELPDWIRQHAAAYAACIAGAIPEGEYLAGLRGAGLEDVVVEERLVYDATQLIGLIGPEVEALGIDPSMLKMAAESVVGKVASVRVTGRKASL